MTQLSVIFGEKVDKLNLSSQYNGLQKKVGRRCATLSAALKNVIIGHIAKELS